MNRRHVVTAGHCVNGADPASVRVTLGEYEIGNSSEPLPRRIYSVVRIDKHPYYHFSPKVKRFFFISKYFP